MANKQYFNELWVITIILNYISVACSSGQKDLVYILKTYRSAELHVEIYFGYGVCAYYVLFDSIYC